MKRRSCTEEELLEFVKNYPRRLERDIARMYDPPLETFNDPLLGKWPDCVVASAMLEDERTDPERARETGWYRDGCTILADSPPTPSEGQ